MLLRLVPLVVIGLLVAGCSADGQPAAGPSPSTPSPGSGPTGTTPTASPAQALPTGCASLLPFTELDRALGRPLFGETEFIKGVPQPSIGRTGRVTCRYGLPRGRKGQAPVEVGVSTYTSAEAAARRVEATVSGARAQGATQSQATVAGVPATLLGEAKTVTLVLAQGSRTVAVTLQRALASTLPRGTRPNDAVVAVTERVLTNLDQ